jgi:flagella basal body P-ring formation protein FlgA
MAYNPSKIGFGAITILLCSFLTSQAAEIRLKKVPIHCTESLVTLADIADVLPMGNENVEPLRQIVLFPTPAEDAPRTLDQWEVRTILSQLGVNTLHHFISGAEKITVSGIAPKTVAPMSEQFVIQANYLAPSGGLTPSGGLKPSRPHADAAPKTAGLTDEIAKLLEKQVAEALSIYLNFTNRLERSWDISLKLTPEQIELFASNGQIVEITGGQVPFTGPQQFQIRMQADVTVTVDAVVKLPTEVVIVRRALPKGHIMSESDLMLQRMDKINGDDFFVDIKSVAGKETTKAVRELTPMAQSAVRMPLWVRRGDIVTVRAVNGGIVVRTEATALQDGVEGETITVAKIDLSPKRGKKEDPVTYLVRVCAPKTVEVFVKNSPTIL